MDANKLASFGFYFNGETTDSANNLGKLGIYRIKALDNYQALNYPVNNGYIVNQYVGGSGYQLFFLADTTTVYYRHKWNRWSDWVRIDNFGYNSLADLASGVVVQNTKPWSFAMNDTSSTSTYYIKIDGSNEVFDHTCRGGGICIVSSQTSKTQILYTDWGAKYRVWNGSNWSEWLNLYNP